MGTAENDTGRPVTREEGSPTRRAVDRHLPLPEIAYREIRGWILSGRVKPGSRLVVAAVAEELGMSAMPVRDALRVLEEHGFVEMFPRRGAVVAVPTVRDIIDLYEIRTALECVAARQAARRRTDADLAKLEALVEEGRQAVRAGDWDAARRLNWAFHETLAQTSQNGQLISMLPVFRHRFAWVGEGTAMERGMAAWDEHATLLEAVEAGDATRAEQIALRHARQSRDLYRAHNPDEDHPAHWKQVPR